MEHPVGENAMPRPTRVEIDLGTAAVPVDVASLESVILWIMNRQRDNWVTVVTPNLHLLRQVRESPDLARLYADASMSLPDGWPVAWLATRIGGQPVRRVPGADLFQAVVEQQGEGRPLVLVGGTPGPQLEDLHIRCRERGWNVFSEPAPRAELTDAVTRRELISRVARAGTGGVIVLGVGSPQKEELSEEIAAGQGHGAVLALGMSINFTAGVVGRAPQVVQSLGLEWLYRALSEPRRLMRRYLADAAALPTLARLNPKRRSDEPSRSARKTIMKRSKQNGEGFECTRRKPLW
jgi:exopolysaccharide biosynthesis WecB/TagA/CpsF family protein